MHWKSPRQQTFDVQPLELPPELLLELLELPPELLPTGKQQDTPWEDALQCCPGAVVVVHDVPASGQLTQFPSVPSHSFDSQLWGLHPDPSRTPANGIRMPNTKM